YFRDELQAVRSGKWKLHLPHKYKTLIRAGKDGLPGEYDYERKIDLSLFDLEKDISESKNVADRFPKVVERLEKAARAFDAELKQNIRPAGHLTELRK
ncbi:MAG: arylsulfatase, partial [Calditrichaeota bacterium]|nr:arylsulfatase [Calditrichota bacterium]